jgi:penicillin-binding protein 1C
VTPQPSSLSRRAGTGWATVTCLAVLTFEVAAAGLSLALPPPLGKLEHASPVVLDRHGRVLRALSTEAGRWRMRAALERVDPIFVQRLLALEDSRFYAHPGVDPLATVRAGVGDLLARRVRSGGSTLDMQLARRLHPRPRNLFAKLIESLRALQLDARLGKEGVLAAYLTLTPYGGNLEGVRAASLAWFGHEPDRLSDAEQALLIALPQAPEARRPDRHPAAAQRARARVLTRLERAGLIAPAARALAEAEPLPRRQPLPALAWQAAGRIAHAAPMAAADVTSTIDAPLQARLEAMARRSADAQERESQVAILVLEVRSRAVRAAVGSARLDRPGGWMDLTRTFRSPGSALKPFIYAMAFEGGQAAPETRIADAPTAYAGYHPHDFDRIFRGEVTARQALQQSLNVPAVHMLAAVGPQVFEDRLRAAGVHLARPRSKLSDASLALALGGEGVRLQDLAMLYAALADAGVAKPLAWTKADAARRPREPGSRLIDPDAAAAVLGILSGTPPPEGRTSPLLTEDGPALAFKTGTSYGFRDAVAVGSGGGYVVAVWTGRADGGARPGLTGRVAALPLMFDVFDALAAETSDRSVPRGGAAPDALQQIRGAQDPPPRLVFPPDRARLQLDRFGASGPGFALAARGQDIRWYADGAALLPDSTTGQTIWRPATPGFYRLEAVDAAGRRVAARVQIER